MNTMTSSMPAARLWRAYLTEAGTECVRYMRAPSFMLPITLFPTLFYLLFGVVMNHTGGEQVQRYLLVSYAVFGVMSPGLFGFGVSLAMERENGLLTLKRALPMPPGAYLIGKMLMAMAAAALVVVLLLVLAELLGGTGYGAGAMLALVVTGALCVLPFCALGLWIGTLVKGQGAAPILNMIYLPMAFLSGLWVPLKQLPQVLQQVAPSLPAYHLDQVALSITGFSHAPIAGHVLALAGYTALFLVLASRRLRRLG